MSDFPNVSIVIVNYNGKRHIPNCLKSIQRLNYPQDKIEVVIVDNGSNDGSVDLISSKYKWVRLIRNSKNEGFAKPSDDGARAASGEYVAFLNNDMRVDKDWLAELIYTMQRNDVQCAGSVISNWDGSLLDFAGGSVSFYGMGYQYDFHKPMKEIEKQLTGDKEILFACGGAMICNREVFLSSGGFDEDYFAYFEDLDLGWRLRLLGYKTILSVKSRVNHRHHSTGSRFAPERMQLLFERNKLYTIYKNYGEALFQKAFWPAVLMDIQILFENSGINKEHFDLRLSTEDLDTMGQKISNNSVAQLAALHEFIVNLPKTSEKREFIQKNRKCSDDEIIRFITNPFLCLGKDSAAYNRSKYGLIKNFGIDQAFHFEYKNKVLLVCNDKIGKKMAGPAIRYFEFAKALSKTCDVTLAAYESCDVESAAFKVITYDYKNYDKLIQATDDSDVVVFHGFVNEFCPEFYEAAKSRFVVIDLYDPYLIENMEVLKHDSVLDRRYNFEFSYKSVMNQLTAGDFFLCANEKQLDYWFGMLTALKRADIEVYDKANDGSKLINLVPFGVSDDVPVSTKNVLKGVWPGINEDDHVLIWGGGVWNWFDPLTLIKALKEISRSRSDVKLFFMGVKHPNPNIADMRMLNEAVELAKSLDLYNKYVFFNFDWVDYNQRQNYLLQSDIGVSFHFETLETRFSFRTRILDYLWADLPIICSKGDYFADLVNKKGLGLTVDCEDVAGVAQAITHMIDDKQFYESCKHNIEDVAQQYKWSKITKPLVEFCENPMHTRKNISEDYKRTKVYSILQSNDIEEAGDSKENEPEYGVNYTEESPDFFEEDSGRSHAGDYMQLAYAISRIQKEQSSIQTLVKRNAKELHDNGERIKDIQKWTFMMNGRFIKIKTRLNPIWLLKKLFRRGM